ncbi:hypothetical protein R5W23_003687 [Gemmata sp. JC673]|uniref:Transmembrane protein n=1 Tax=Gemmata algarum TaxID=2975278 RepID=A0ABU5F3T6_9BACT|nr:hypothetical protein [Gemmata algarum]MDY3562225.1 hypothetical protein [Gemmata algarum]
MPNLTRPNLWLWLSRVFGWDGCLPLFVVLLPAVVGAVAPNAEKAISMLAIFLPIAALFARYYIGRRAVASNRVGPALRFCQQVVFTASILLLLLLECFVIALHLAPAVPLGDLCAVVVLYATYLTGMMFAMFPGWADGPRVQDANRDEGNDERAHV